MTSSEPAVEEAELFYFIARFVLRPLFILWCRPTVLGREGLPLTGPLLLASNHRSFIDSIAIPLMAPRRVGYLAKAEYFTGTGLKGWASKTLFAALGARPIERQTQRAAQAALDTVLHALEHGEAFGIYPEGTRSRDGSLARGKTGVAWLALTTDCPVVPVAVRGTEKVQPIGARYPRPHKVTITFGTPMTFPDQRGLAGNNRARRVVTDRVMEAIVELSGQQKSGW